MYKIRFTEQNAKAVSGMAPKINIWNTGDSANKSTDAFGFVKQMFTNLPPMFDVLQQQTNFKTPFLLPIIVSRKMVQFPGKINDNFFIKYYDDNIVKQLLLGKARLS